MNKYFSKLKRILATITIEESRILDEPMLRDISNFTADFSILVNNELQNNRMLYRKLFTDDTKTESEKINYIKEQSQILGKAIIDLKESHNSLREELSIYKEANITEIVKFIDYLMFELEDSIENYYHSLNAHLDNLYDKGIISHDTKSNYKEAISLEVKDIILLPTGTYFLKSLNLAKNIEVKKKAGGHLKDQETTSQSLEKQDRQLTPEEQEIDKKWEDIIKDLKNLSNEKKHIELRSINYNYDTIMNDPNYHFEAIVKDILYSTGYGGDFSHWFRTSHKENEQYKETYKELLKITKEWYFLPIINALKAIKNGASIYRILGDKEQIKNKTKEMLLSEFLNNETRNVGIYWTYTLESFHLADYFMHMDKDKAIILEAQVPIDSIDIYTTFETYFENLQIREREITLVKGSPILIKNILHYADVSKNNIEILRKDVNIKMYAWIKFNKLNQVKSFYDEENALYRFMDVQELKLLLEIGRISPQSYKFISLSHRINAGEKAMLPNNISVVFDKKKLYQQGAKDIDYEDLEYEEVLHIQGISKEIYPKSQYDDEKETLKELEAEFGDYEASIDADEGNFIFLGDSSKYYEENEVIIKRIVYEKDLIKFVYLRQEDLSVIEYLLKKNDIPYRIMNEKYVRKSF